MAAALHREQLGELTNAAYQAVVEAAEKEAQGWLSERHWEDAGAGRTPKPPPLARPTRARGSCRI